MASQTAPVPVGRRKTQADRKLAGCQIVDFCQKFLQGNACSQHRSQKLEIKKKWITHIAQTIVFIGVPETIRTSDPFFSMEVLYPAELRGQGLFLYNSVAVFARFQNFSSENTFSSGSFFLPCRNSSSAMKQHSKIFPPRLSTISTTAAIVPPVASTSSAIRMFSPGLIASVWISRVSVPYSRS